jgi:thioredoxin reductase
LLASGVEWRRLDVPGIEELLGAGVYYGAGPSEALGCAGAQVVIIGGGNSAGQAAVRFSRCALRVSLLVRGPDLAASMSKYLIDTISGIPNIEVRTGTQVVDVKADERLTQGPRHITPFSNPPTTPCRLPVHLHRRGAQDRRRRRDRCHDRERRLHTHRW